MKKDRLGREKEKLEKESERLREFADKIKAKEGELNVLEGTIKSLSEDLEYLEERSNEKEIRDEIEKKNKELSSGAENLDKAEGKVREFLSEQGKIKVFIEELSGRIENLKVASGKCPVCERELTGEHKEKILEESRLAMAGQEERLRKVRDEIKFIEESSLRLKDKIAKIRDRKYELEGALQKAIRYGDKRKKMDKCEENRRELERELAKLKKAAEEEKSLEVQRKLQELSGLLSEARVSMESNSMIIKERESQLKDLVDKKKAFDRHKQQIDKMNDISEDLNKFEKALKETQVTLRREFVDSVNFTMDRIWEYLYPYEDLTNIRLSINEGDYSLELKEVEGKWVSVEGIASGGERTTACLALRIAFALVLAPNLKWLVLDEPTHNLDSQAVEYLAEVLRDRVGEFVEQVFLITHDEKLENAVTGYLYKLERKREKNEPTQVSLVSAPKD